MKETTEKQTMSIQQIAERWITTRSGEDYMVLYNRLLPGLRNTVNKYKGSLNYEDREEVLFQTFANAYDLIDRYDPQWAFSTWIYKICNNQCLTMIREKKRKYSLDEMHENSNVSRDFISATSVQPIDLTEEVVDQEQMLADIYTAIEEIDPTYGDVAKARIINQMGYEDIAEMLDLPVNTVRSRIHVAKNLIRQKMRFPVGASSREKSVFQLKRCTCQDCGLRFTRKSSATKHANKAGHNVTEDENASKDKYKLKYSNSEKQYVCTECGTEFLTSRGKTVHEKKTGHKVEKIQDPSTTNKDN